VPDQRLLEDVSFTVEPGRTVAIVGATASGKSTLTALLARLVDPDRGRILIDGVDLRDLDRGQLAGVEALVPQTAFLFDDTVRGNVTLDVQVGGADVSDEQVWAALDVLGADRIGHGVRSIEDPALVRELARRRVPLEVCPTSNVKLGLYPSYAAHPLRRLYDAGVPVTVNSDDPGLFGTSISHEASLLVSDLGFSAAEAAGVCENAGRFAFRARVG
jgi:adenosine deaminase